MRGLLLALVLLVSCSAVWAGAPKPPKPQQAHPPRLIVVVASRLVLSDLHDPSLPTIHKMLRGGAVGLISPNCAGPKSEASVLLTANAGSPCRGGNYVKEFYNTSEQLLDGTSAGEAYALRTGRKAPKGSAVLLGVGQALRDAAKLSSVPAKLGELGDALHAAGLRTGIVSDAQTLPDGTERSVAVLAMDSRGVVDCGDLHAVSLFEIRCSQGSVLISAPDAMRKADVVFLNFADSVILDETKISMSDSAYAANKARMLRYLDTVLHQLTTQPETRGKDLILVSFSPPSGTPWDQLTPVIYYGPIFPGLLTSATTRTPGLIAASDFAPLVLGLMNLDPSEDMIGRCPKAVESSRGPERLADMSARVTANERILTPVAVGLAGIGAVSFTIAALIIAFGLKPSRRVIGLLKAGLVTGGCTFAALLLGVLAPAGVAGYVTGTAVSLVLLSGVCLGLGKLLAGKASVRALPIILVFAITTAIIFIDAVTGCYLCKWCGPSSYQITGMRFYGIGNEYAGVLVSMAAMVALFLRDRKWVLPVLGIATIVVLGSGSLGANYGGTATAVVTFGLMWLAVSRKGFSARHVVLMLALAIAAVVGFAMLDWLIAGSAGTHAARATGLTEKLGGGYLWAIASRKVAFNLKTTFSTVGLRSMLAFVPFLALWFWGVQGKLKSLFASDARVSAGVKAVLVGAATAYMLNDSGIVFAAIMVAITVLVLLYSVLEEVRPHPSPLLAGEGAGCTSAAEEEAGPCRES